MSTRLEILQNSLKKKEAELDRRIGAYIDDVKSANGQPLNDKRNGRATLNRWEKKDNSARNQAKEIEKTKRAIEIEEFKISRVENADVPQFLLDMVAAGELTQWRKHPTFFFVTGVERGRLHWDAKKKELAHRYSNQVPKDQFEQFKSVVNKALKISREQTQP